MIYNTYKMYTNLSKESYAQCKTWQELYEEQEYTNSLLSHEYIDESWKPLFKKLTNTVEYEKIQECLFKTIEDKSAIMIHPAPEFVYNAFVHTSFNNTKIVILGQDPYFNFELYGDKQVSQAMGLSFSLPHEFAIPSSLANIFKNLTAFGHHKKSPKTGNLESWAIQGCLLLNTALTVNHNNKKSHSKIWELFTNSIIQYISANKDHVVFMLWGADAHKKKQLIDNSKHKIIMSSHPSGLSVHTTTKSAPSFSSTNHFGIANEYLRQFDIEEIDW